MSATTISTSNDEKSKNRNLQIIKKKIDRDREEKEREDLVLYYSPLTTLYYCLLECIHKIRYLFYSILYYQKTVLLLTSLVILEFTFYHVDTRFKPLAQYIHKKFIWYGWWILLGFLSSCGFGTGLHTFVLYLGPFIAEVTMGAFECNTVNFPEPPYPDQITCPETKLSKNEPQIGLLTVIMKTQVEAILWGLGTAIGELPPYFMARSARISGSSIDDLEELKEVEDFIAENKNKNISIFDSKISIKIRIEYALHNLITKAGFIGILLCASIPNPLFDLAGMTCGHFLVPFWNFFLATFIGKAIIKVHIQMIVVVLIMSKDYLNIIIENLSKIPVFGEKMKPQFMEFIANQQEKLHSKTVGSSGSNIIGTFIGAFVLILMGSFLVSIISSFAQEYHRRLCNWRHQAEGELVKEKN